VFDALWGETELRNSLEKTARQANLLQDILAHDIRNYNQAARLSAELLQDEFRDNVAAQSLVENLLKAIDGSTDLLQRTRRLGSILAEENPKLHPVSLVETIRESLALIKASHHEKRIDFLERYEVGRSAFVLADDLLGEVFTNLFSNAVKYTEGEQVEIELVVQPVRESSQRGGDGGGLLRITIGDQGSGIPDETKKRIFARYLSSAKGSGLGLSIVHALVVERYKGSLKIRDRISGDHTKGTVVEIELPSATATSSQT
jgi:signal transduction histidine kinase